MYKVLIVEDNLEIAKPLIALLNNCGFETEHCMRGNSVLGAFQDFAPDLILLDLVLPVVDGLEVCQQIRRVSDLPIIIISAEASPIIRLKCFELGANDFVEKPFGIAKLITLIETNLKQRKTKRCANIKIDAISENLPKSITSYH
ncbi:response regulator transcription factor [Aliikangiella coralliicola]|uniref:Response regulator transcription factor n=1 Tax=Aliikangiella coralliicola TaxID=2592383 RepID=A0A545UJ35_9GAMM|nr:response regulator [Aliikangiella coralliicola]TQV89477.1 response regulator transcription factor [Aliikangiella coralliicola]